MAAASTATTRRPSTKGEQTRRAILAAAIERFGREGYRATSVADIARDAGVGGTVAYAYFPNTETLFLEAFDEDASPDRWRSGQGTSVLVMVVLGSRSVVNKKANTLYTHK